MINYSLIGAYIEGCCISLIPLVLFNHIIQECNDPLLKYLSRNTGVFHVPETFSVVLVTCKTFQVNSHAAGNDKLLFKNRYYREGCCISLLPITLQSHNLRK